MRIVTIALTVVVLVAPPIPAQVSNPAGMAPATPQVEPGKPAAHQPNTQDRLFIQLVGSGGLAEVETGRLAERKASSGAVREFARRMAQDHAKSNDELASLAKVAGVAVPSAPDPQRQAERTELDKLSGGAFDLAYMRAQLVDHQKTSTLLLWEISHGQDAAVQRHAMQTLPVVLQHLEMAQAVLGQLTGAGPQGLAATAPARVVGTPDGPGRARERSSR